MKRSETKAPVASGPGTFTNTDARKWPAAPPKPLGRAPQPPVFRPLKVYAFGPSLGRSPINIRTLLVRYEPLAPGPVGERIAVIDYDAARDCYYDPVDLDHTLIAMAGGLDPSESDPWFHQQMVYAVTSDALRRVELALGRTILWRTATTTEPLRIVIYPHGDLTQNSYGVENRMVFGYFQAGEEAKGRTVPGQTVFTCLSTDVVVHQTSHALMTALRPDLMTAPAGDTKTIQETLADATALLFHFSYRAAVLDTIQRTAGVIYRSQLDSGSDAPRIVAEYASSNPLLAVSQDFGEAIGQPGGLRNAIAAPDPKGFAAATEAHARSQFVVAAIFDAVFSVYQRRTLDLFRIYRAGGGDLSGNDVPEPLAQRLADEVEHIATRVLEMCWRALDYCPPGAIEVGDFLRACITADYEACREDPWGLRDAVMQSFRLRGMQSSTAAFFTEDAMRWPVVDASLLTAPGPAEMTQKAVRDFATANRAVLGLQKGAVVVAPIDRASYAGDAGTQVTHITQAGTARSGVTLVFVGDRVLRYAIATTATS